MHMALRAPKGVVLPVDGKDVVPEVHAVLDSIAAFSAAVRSGEWKVCVCVCACVHVCVHVCVCV